CLLAMHLRRPYDVIHVHTVPDFEVFAAFLPKCLGAKVILDLHELSPELYLSKFRSDQDSAIYRRMIQVEKASVSFADYVIIVNDFCQKTLLARSPCQRKCTVFLNYPDPTIFHPRPRQPDRGNHECRLLYPGTLNWHQGLDVAIRAFARIRDAAGQAHFYIYGQGPERSRLEALIRQLSLENRVHILPMQPIEAIAGIMAQSDIGVVPKRKDSFGNEAISTKIFEFMSLGVPVVAADTRIDTHYFSDATIQFFRSGDEQDLADKLLDLIRNRRKRNRLAREAQRFVQRYSWRWHRDRYLALIDRLSGRAATGGTAEPDGPSGPAP
ncbi:MAG: glycosyltransferase family 4 protein, partial [Sedimentisphaerales bacterium]|nr:glycosyltransferase family 4 protein [Sedimentisphaerales bacterium]